MTSNNTNHPQVWVGCLACYNDGRLVGEWIDAEDAEDITIDSLHDYLPATLRTQVERDSAHDELWCFDTNNMPKSGEMQPMDAAMWGRAYVELSDDSLWPAYMRWCYDVMDASEPPEVARFRQAYQGEYGSFADFGWEQYCELKPTEGMTDEQERYFDYEQWLRDLEMDYHVLPTMKVGSVWVFDAAV